MRILLRKWKNTKVKKKHCVLYELCRHRPANRKEEKLEERPTRAPPEVFEANFSYGYEKLEEISARSAENF